MTIVRGCMDRNECSIIIVCMDRNECSIIMERDFMKWKKTVCTQGFKMREVMSVEFFLYMNRNLITH